MRRLMRGLALASIATSLLSACAGGSNFNSMPRPIASSGPTSPIASAEPTPAATATVTPTQLTFNIPGVVQHITIASNGKVWFTSNSQATGETQAVGYVDPLTGAVSSFNPLTAGESSYLMVNQITPGADGSVWYDLN